METSNPITNMIIGAILLFIIQIIWRAIKNRKGYHTIMLSADCAYLKVDDNDPELFTQKVTFKPDKAIYHPVSLSNFFIAIAIQNEDVVYVFECQRDICPISMQEICQMYGRDALVESDPCRTALIPILTDLAQRMFEQGTKLFTKDDIPSQFDIVNVSKVAKKIASVNIEAA